MERTAADLDVTAIVIRLPKRQNTFDCADRNVNGGEALRARSAEAPPIRLNAGSRQGSLAKHCARAVVLGKPLRGGRYRPAVCSSRRACRVDENILVFYFAQLCWLQRGLLIARLSPKYRRETLARLKEKKGMSQNVVVPGGFGYLGRRHFRVAWLARQAGDCYGGRWQVGR